MLKLVLWLLFPLFPVPTLAASPRTLHVAPDQVPEIKTSLGYSTVIRFDSRPKSVVLGDQDAYRVDYLPNALSIKPLLPASSTNLFVFTDTDAFTFRLTSVQKGKSDFVISVRRARDKTLKSGPEGQALKAYGLSGKSTQGNITLTLKSIAVPKSGAAYLLRFAISLSPQARESLRLQNNEFALKQQGRNLPIHDSHLNTHVLAPGTSTDAILIVRRRYVDSANTVTLGFTSQGTSSQTIVIDLPTPLPTKESL